MATNRTKVALSVYLEAEQRARLREAVARTGVPAAVLIRRGLDRELEATAYTISAWHLLTPEIVAQLSPVERLVLSHRLSEQAKLLEGL